MYVDYLTLACLRDRLDGLLGARVQRVLLIDELSVGLELYAGKRLQLLVSAHPQYARVMLVPQKLRRGTETATPLLLLLRKWVRNGRLVDVTQPAWERILELHFEGKAGSCCLTVELIGRYSNAILVGSDGCVLGAAKHVGPDMNRYRVILPGQPYQPPPVPPGRQPPTNVPASEWRAMLASADADAPLHTLLTHRLLGVSPILAQEIATRAAGNSNAPAGAADPEAVCEAVAALFAPIEGKSAWSPHVALDDDDNVIAFAPYEPRQFERVERAADINAAMWRYFQRQLSADPYTAVRLQVQRLLDQAKSRVERTRSQLESQVVDEAEVSNLRQAGELLLAYQRQVKRGAQEITLPDQSGEPRTIDLDPARTPVENAQAYFRRYKKAVRAAEGLAARIATLDLDAAYLEQLAADLALAESRPEIEAVRHALAEAGWTPPARRKSNRVEGPRHLNVSGFSIYVGRNARQNEELTFKRAGPDDLWFHVRGMPGAHVIVKSERKTVPEEIIQRAAELAAYYSPARGESSADVDVTEQRFVKRVRGSHPGHVTYRNEQTIRVKPGR